jgi:hypothetical protein
MFWRGFGFVAPCQTLVARFATFFIAVPHAKHRWQVAEIATPKPASGEPSPRGRGRTEAGEHDPSRPQHGMVFNWRHHLVASGGLKGRSHLPCEQHQLHRTVSDTSTSWQHGSQLPHPRTTVRSPRKPNHCLSWHPFNITFFDPSALWSDDPEVEHGAHFLILYYPSALWSDGPEVALNWPFPYPI